MSEDEPQSEGMKALEQSLNDHMEICRLERKAKRLKVENARLKAEVERLISVSEAWKKRRLDKVEAECIKWSDYEKLKAEVERLRKAGDAMAEALNLNDDVFDNQEKKEAQAAWNAAKEGKQP